MSGLRKQMTLRKLAVLASLVTVFGMAGCGEDDTEVSTSLSGEGTLDSPYIIQSGVTYQDIMIEKGGTLFFIAIDVPAAFNEVSTTSAVDINLIVSGFLSFFGGEDDGNGSFTPGSGNESYAVLGDGSGDLYFQVDGTHVFSGGATFDLSVLTVAAPPLDLVVALNSCSVAVASPNSSCDTDSFATQFVPLPFPAAPQAALTITMTRGPAAPHAYLRAFDNFNFSGPPPGGPGIPFPSNNPGLSGGFSDGYCHVNSDWWGGFGGIIGQTGTCTISPVPGVNAPRMLYISAGSNTGGPDVTLSFSTP